MRLIGYVRVSTDDQAANGHSLGQQMERLRQYCALHDHELVELVTDEGVSASVPLGKRKGGALVEAMLASGRADGVVVIRLDRLFRDALDGLLFFRTVADADGAAVHSIAELIDTSTPAGRLMLTIQLGVAQYDRDLDVARAKETSTALRQSGKVYAGVPYGCVSAGGQQYFDEAKGRHRTRGAQLYRDPKTWATREHIVAMRRENLSWVRIGEELRRLHVPAPGGGRSWSRATLRNIVDTHASLHHLPLAETKSGVHKSTNHETRVSRHG
jgi:site-specific DNA recombinase